MKDIKGNDIEIGDLVKFYSYCPDKKEEFRIVRNRDGKLWAGEVPLGLLDEPQRELTIESKYNEINFGD